MTVGKAIPAIKLIDHLTGLCARQLQPYRCGVDLLRLWRFNPGLAYAMKFYRSLFNGYKIICCKQRVESGTGQIDDVVVLQILERLAPADDLLWVQCLVIRGRYLSA
jgi:hypothetical protein